MPWLAAACDQAVFELHAAGAGLAVAGGKDDRVPHSGGGGVLDHRRDRLGGREDEGQVGGLGQLAQGPDGGTAEDVVVPRMHGQQRAGVPDGRCWRRR